MNNLYKIYIVINYERELRGFIYIGEDGRGRFEDSIFNLRY